LKDWMFAHVYQLEVVDETQRARAVICALFDKFMENPKLMKGEYAELCQAQDRSTPALVKDLTDVRQIAAGNWHSLASKTDGTLWAWGNNTTGQLGDGTTTTRSAPVLVKGVQQ